MMQEQTGFLSSKWRTASSSGRAQAPLFAQALRWLMRRLVAGASARLDLVC